MQPLDHQPQSTILSGITEHACFMTILLKPSSYTSFEQVLIMSHCLDFLQEIQAKQPAVQMAIGFGRLFLKSVLSNIADESVQYIRDYMRGTFQEYPKKLEGKFGGFPDTGGDIFLHIKSEKQYECFEVAKQFVTDSHVMNRCVASVQDETFGFAFKRNPKTGLGRDLSGFEDGTENPTELDEKVEATLTPNGDSFLLAQKWIHNLKFFHSLSLKEQEADIGRTKQDSIELEDKPPTSHVARVVIEEDGKEIDVIRQSMPFGSLREHGLFFISYANSTKIFTHQLESMVGKGKHATPEGHNDHLMRFSRNVLGSFYYVPSLSSLKRVVDGLMLHHHRLSKL